MEGEKKLEESKFLDKEGITRLWKNVENVENMSAILDQKVDDAVSEICRPIDLYMNQINKYLLDLKEPVPDEALEQFILNIPPLLYFISEAREKVLIRSEVSKEVYKELFGNARKEATGTVADRDNYARSKVMAESFASIVYQSIYTRIKAKEEAATEMLQSLKKIMNRRVAEIELSRGVK